MESEQTILEQLFMSRKMPSFETSSSPTCEKSATTTLWYRTTLFCATRKISTGWIYSQASPYSEPAFLAMALAVCTDTQYCLIEQLNAGTVTLVLRGHCPSLQECAAQMTLMTWFHCSIQRGGGGGEGVPIDHLRNDIKQHTRTPFLTIPGSNSMWTFRWIGREGREIGSESEV